MTGHTLACALEPKDCSHTFADITQCVVCGSEPLADPRDNAETCSTACARELEELRSKPEIRRAWLQRYGRESDRQALGL